MWPNRSQKQCGPAPCRIPGSHQKGRNARSAEERSNTANDHDESPVVLCFGHTGHYFNGPSAGGSEGVSDVRKSLNLHRMKGFRLGNDTHPVLAMNDLNVPDYLGSTSAGWFQPTGCGHQTQSPQRKSEILKFLPIGCFIEFSLRAD
jgi:hypothetical protein